MKRDMRMRGRTCSALAQFLALAQSFPIALCCALMMSAWLAVSSFAQQDYWGEVRKSEAARTPIVIEDFPVDASLGFTAFYYDGQTPEDLLAQDLVNMSVFQVVRQRAGDAAPAVLDVNGDPVTNAIVARVRGRIVGGRGGPQLDLELLEEGTRAEIIRCSYPVFSEGEAQPDRWQIHIWADSVTRYLTGSPGCAATRIAFLREGGSGKELYLIDWDGKEEETVTGMATVLVSPEWHPGGKRIAFTSFHRGQPLLVSLDLATRRMITLSDKRTPSAGAYSPSGRQIAFSAATTGDAEIYVARSDGSHPERLTFDKGIDTAPSWSPSGDRVVFTSDRRGTPQLYVMDADGSNVAQLTFDGKWNDSPDWSPNGERIVYVCSVDGKFEVAVVSSSGLSAPRIVTRGGGCEDPHWAPDSRHVVFSRSIGGQRNLWIVDVDTGSLRQLTFSRAQTYNPAWSPLAERRIRASGETG